MNDQTEAYMLGRVDQEPYEGPEEPMSESTRGPWTLETVITQVGVCHKIGKLGSSTKLNHACLYDDCYSTKPRDLQLLADAHLIAAAPDLLDALREMLGAWDAGVVVDAADAEIARAAIAKAEQR